LKLDPFGQPATSRYGEGVARRPPAGTPTCRRMGWPPGKQASMTVPPALRRG